MSTKKRKPLGSAMEEFVFGTKEAVPAPTPPEEVVSPAPTPTASLTPFALLPASTPPTPPTLETALPTATPPQPEVSVLDPVPIQSKEPSLISKLQAPDKEATVRFTVDIGSKDEAQKSGYRADVVGGWVEGGRRVKAIIVAHIKVVKKFSKPPKSLISLAP